MKTIKKNIGYFQSVTVFATNKLCIIVSSVTQAVIIVCLLFVYIYVLYIKKYITVNAYSNAFTQILSI